MNNNIQFNPFNYNFMKQLVVLVILMTSLYSFSQKKILDHPDFEIWNTIEGATISSDGKFIMYSLEKGEKDNTLKLKDEKGNLLFSNERSENGKKVLRSLAGKVARNFF